MRPLILALACALVLSCGVTGARTGGAATFSDLVACIKPVDTPPAPTMVAALVDRADIVAVFSVDKAERTYQGYFDEQGARRLTLRTLEALKGSPAAGFVMDDGRCPGLVAREGETLVAFLDRDGLGYRPIVYPQSAIRPTADRTLAQIVAELRAVRPLDGDAKALFERYGWRVTGKRDVDQTTLPPLEQWPYAGRQIRGAEPYLRVPLERIATLSGAVALDPRPYAAKPAERLSFWLETPPPEYRDTTVFGHVLIADRTIVGAWVTIGTAPSAFALSERTTALASPTAAPFPPPNRVPQGANIAKMYDLASARSIAYKTARGGSGEIADPAKIRAIASSLDQTLPTTQAVWPPPQSLATYWLHFLFATSTVSLTYDSAAGTLTVVEDGFTATAPASLAPLVADFR